MDAAAILGIIGKTLEIALKLAQGIGDVVTAKKVQAILDEGKFPGFYDRAREAGEDAREALDDRKAPNEE